MSPTEPIHRAISKRYIPFSSRPGQRLFSIGVEVDERAGLLAEVTAALHRASLNLIASTSATAPGNGDHATFSIIGEAEPGRVDPAQLKRTLEAIRSVRTVEIQTDHDGVIIDDLYPTYSGMGRRLLLISLDPMRDMLMRIGEMLGSGGSVLLYTQGKAFGESAWARVIDYVGREWALDHLDYLPGVLTALGYGQAEVTGLDRKTSTVTVRIKGCMECFERESPTIACHFIRGIVESLFAAGWGRPMTSAETHCAAHGDPACEFQISPAEPPAATQPPA